MPTKPMRKLFATLLLTSLALPLHAQRSNASSTGVPPRPIAATAEKEEKPKAEKAGESRSLLRRIFGPRPTPPPVPAPPPAPVAKKNVKPKPKTGPAEMPEEAIAKVTPKRPAGTVPPPVTPPTTAGVKPKAGKTPVKKGGPTSTDPAGLDDGTKFKTAKTKALEDAHIKDLKGKADSEVNEAEAHKALVNYNRALFQKIREIDPSVSDYAGKVEQSMTKRIGAETAKQ